MQRLNPRNQNFVLSFYVRVLVSGFSDARPDSVTEFQKF